MAIPQIVPLSQAIAFWNILLYADSGAGKTVWAGQDDGTLFIAPEDDGLESARTMGSNASKIAVKEYKDLIDAYEYLYDNPEVLKGFKVLCIDSLTEMQMMCMRYILKTQVDERKSKGQDPDQPQIQDYGKMHQMFDKLVRAFNDLDINVVYTALSRKVEDADHNEFLVPEIAGKDYGIAMKTVSLMTSYGYLRTEIHEVPAPTEDEPNATKPVKRRVIYWEDTGTIRGKDRTNSLAPFTVNASLKHVRMAIEGKLMRNDEGRIVRKAAPAAKKASAKAVAPQPERTADTTPAADEPIKVEPPVNVPVQASPQPTKEVESTPAAEAPAEAVAESNEVELDSVEA